MRGHSKNKNAIFEKGVWYVNKNKMRELEKEIRNTKSWKRKRDLYKHLKRLQKAEYYATKNDKKQCKKSKNLQQKLRGVKCKLFIKK